MVLQKFPGKMIIRKKIPERNENDPDGSQGSTTDWQDEDKSRLNGPRVIKMFSNTLNDQDKVNHARSTSTSYVYRKMALGMLIFYWECWYSIFERQIDLKLSGGSWIPSASSTSLTMASAAIR